jgi:hypothetical protein
MQNPDKDSDRGELSHRQQGHEPLICSVSMNGKTVLFDATSTDRGIQSETTIELAENV